MEDLVRLFKKQLFSAFWDWVEKNKSQIGEKNYNWFLNKGKKAEDDCNTALKVMATALWIFSMISNFGVMAGIGPNSVHIENINANLDQESTKRLLHMCASCLSLQFLPREYAMKEIPIISGKHFSLKLWTETRG